MANRSPSKTNTDQDILQDVGLTYGLAVLIAGVFLVALLLRTLTAALDGQLQSLVVYGTGGLILLGCLVLALRRPSWILPLAIALIPLQYALYLPWFRYRLTLSEVLVLVWLLVEAGRALLGQRKLRIPRTSINLLLVAYVAVLTTSLLGLRLLPSPAASQAVFLEWVAQVYLVVLFVLLVAYADTREEGGDRIKILVGSWGMGAFFAAAAAFLAILHYPTGLFAFDAWLPLVSETHKVTGLFRNSNAFASYALVSLLVFGSLLLYGRQSSRIKRLLVVLSTLLALSLALTQSQGAWGGLGVGVMLLSLPKLFAGTKRLRQALVFSFVGLLVVGLFLLSGYPITALPGYGFATQLVSLSGYEIERLPQRFVVLALHRDAWMASPLFGIGIGGLKAYTAWLTSGELARGAHNALIGVAAETGLAGVIVVALMGAAMIHRSLVNLRREWGQWLPLATGLAVAFIAQQVYGLSHDVRGEKHLWLVMALIVAVYLDYQRSAPASFPESDHEP